MVQKTDVDMPCYGLQRSYEREFGVSDVFIRMVWDFYGPDCQPTAVHFKKHVVEFLVRTSTPHLDLEMETVDVHHVAVFIDLERANLHTVGQALHPHRVYEVSNEPTD